MAAEKKTDDRFVLRNARYLAADYMTRSLREGDVAVDATMGNGHDTQFLCGLVGESGRVYAFDVQQSALDNTAARLEAAGLRSRAELILSGHEKMAEYVKTPVRAVMFNLGWLPGAEHIVTTKTNTTLEAVRAAAQLLLPGGIMTVCVYPGHEEGTRELAALLEWASGLDVRTFNVLHHHFICAAPNTPRLILIQKNL